MKILHAKGTLNIFNELFNFCSCAADWKLEHLTDEGLGFCASFASLFDTWIWSVHVKDAVFLRIAKHKWNSWNGES